MKKIILISIILITMIFWGCGTNKNTASSTENTNTKVESTKEKASPALEEPTEMKTELKYFPTDEIVDNFFVKYNTLTKTQIDTTEIQKGNIKTKALVYTEDFNMEVVSTKKELYVSIGTNPENEDSKLYEAFTTCIKAMCENYSNEEIDSAWKDIHKTGYLVEGYELNDVQITYVPYKELSSGHSNLRIDLMFKLK